MRSNPLTAAASPRAIAPRQCGQGCAKESRALGESVIREPGRELARLPATLARLMMR